MVAATKAKAEIFDASMFAYHQREELSSSGMGNFLEDPEEWWLVRKGILPKRHPSASMEFGTIVHGIIENGGDIDKFVCRRPPEFDDFKPMRGWESAVEIPQELIRENGSIQTGKDYTEWKKEFNNPKTSLKDGEDGTLIMKPNDYQAHQQYAAWYKANENKKFLNADEPNPFELIVNAIRACDLTRHWLDEIEPWHKEKNVRWLHEPSGLWCRCRIDLHDPRGVIVDFKTTKDIRRHKFLNQALGLNYLNKAAFYQLAVEQLTGEIQPFVILAIKNQPGYGIKPYELPERRMAEAREFVNQTLIEMAQFDFDQFQANKQLESLEQ